VGGIAVFAFVTGGYFLTKKASPVVSSSNSNAVTEEPKNIKGV